MHVLTSDVVLLLPLLDLFIVYNFCVICLIMIENKNTEWMNNEWTFNHKTLKNTICLNFFEKYTKTFSNWNLVQWFQEKLLTAQQFLDNLIGKMKKTWSMAFCKVFLTRNIGNLAEGFFDQVSFMTFAIIVRDCRKISMVVIVSCGCYKVLLVFQFETGVHYDMAQNHEIIQ